MFGVYMCVRVCFCVYLNTHTYSRWLLFLAFFNSPIGSSPVIYSPTSLSYRIIDHCLRRRLQWNSCFARKVCKEGEYYEEMMRYLRRNLAVCMKGKFSSFVIWKLLLLLQFNASTKTTIELLLELGCYQLMIFLCFYNLTLLLIPKYLCMLMNVTLLLTDFPDMFNPEPIDALLRTLGGIIIYKIVIIGR